jgi:hypothetical protein
MPWLCRTGPDAKTPRVTGHLRGSMDKARAMDFNDVLRALFAGDPARGFAVQAERNCLVCRGSFTRLPPRRLQGGMDRCAETGPFFNNAQEKMIHDEQGIGRDFFENGKLRKRQGRV